MKTLLTLSATLLGFFYALERGAAQPDLVFGTAITTVSSPVDIASANDGTDRLFIVEKGGRIRILHIPSNVLEAGNFLDISTLVSTGSEQGLLGLAFHPNYATNGFFYVNYTNTSGHTRVSRFTASPPSTLNVDESTECNILAVAQPFSNHNGGDLAFGSDGFLYIALGDGGGSGDPGNRSQNPAELLGKMLRIDVGTAVSCQPYTVPASNPWKDPEFTPPNDTLDEIWALGLRNPWRFSFDRLTHDLWIADVGQTEWEEINFTPASSTGGENYGWRCYEGTHPFSPSGCGNQSAYDPPIYDYPDESGTGGFSITGGYMYRGTDVPSLQGWYVVADYISDNCWLIKSNGAGGWLVDLQVDPANGADISSFGEDHEGELYAARLSGQVHKISANPILPVELASLRATPGGGQVLLEWSTASESNASHFSVERRAMGEKTFKEIGKVNAAGGSAGGKSYSFPDSQPEPGVSFYRLEMVDLDGSFKHSHAVSAKVERSTSWQLSPNPADGGGFSLLMDSEESVSSLHLRVFDIHGKAMISKEVESPGFPLRLDFAGGELPAGVYFCELRWDGKLEAQRLVVR